MMNKIKLFGAAGAVALVGAFADEANASGLTSSGLTHQDLVEAGLADPVVTNPAANTPVDRRFFTDYPDHTFKGCRYDLKVVRGTMRVAPIDCCNHITQEDRIHLEQVIANKYGYQTSVLSVRCDEEGEPNIPKEIEEKIEARGTCIGSCEGGSDDQNSSFSRDTSPGNRGGGPGGGNTAPGPDFN